MPIVPVRIPQLGEGLQEARLVEFLKRPGDRVKRDEPIYVMETDKAITEVESPYEGTLVEWVAETNAVLPIGAELARMEVAEGVSEMASEDAHPPAASVTAATSTSTARPVRHASGVQVASVPIPPRTRKYLREKGLLEVADQIPAAGSKLMPEDVDRYLAAGGSATELPSSGTSGYVDRPLSPSQLTLNYRLKRGAEACVPATIIVDMDWQSIADQRQRNRGTDEDETAFSIFLWCVVQALKDHPAFRSSLSADGKTLRTYDHVNLGVAVALPGDVLKTAVVHHADTMDRAAFRESLKQQIEKVREGDDQIDATTTITVSNIGKANVRLGIPVVVKPAVATMAVGEVFDRPVALEDGMGFRPTVTVSLTFDHLVVNGVGAANFLNHVRQSVESFAPAEVAQS